MKGNTFKHHKINVSVSLYEMEHFEDLMGTITLCKEHNRLTPTKTERELMTMRYECKACQKEWDKQMKAVGKVYSQLWKGLYPKIGWDVKK